MATRKTAKTTPKNSDLEFARRTEAIALKLAPMVASRASIADLDKLGSIVDVVKWIWEKLSGKTNDPIVDRIRELDEEIDDLAEDIDELTEDIEELDEEIREEDAPDDKKKKEKEKKEKERERERKKQSKERKEAEKQKAEKHYDK